MPAVLLTIEEHNVLWSFKLHLNVAQLVALAKKIHKVINLFKCAPYM